MCRYQVNSFELYSLGKGHLPGPVDCAGLAPHVGFPGVRPGLPAAAGFLLTPEGAADFGAGGADIHVGNTTIAPPAAEKQFRLAPGRL